MNTPITLQKKEREEGWCIISFKCTDTLSRRPHPSCRKMDMGDCENAFQTNPHKPILFLETGRSGHNNSHILHIMLSHMQCVWLPTHTHTSYAVSYAQYLRAINICIKARTCQPFFCYVGLRKGEEGGPPPPKEQMDTKLVTNTTQ